MKNILVFTPSASRGGSEMSLLNLIRNADFNLFRFHVIAGQEGSLIDEFREVCEVSVFPSSKDRKWQIAQKFLRNAINYDLDQKFIESIHRKFNADFWYINTSVLPNIASLAIELNVKFIVHFHELLSVFDQMKGKTFKNMINHSALNICCSQKIKSYLDEFESTKNTVFNKQVTFERLVSSDVESNKLKLELNLSNYPFIWIMSGATSPRKGFDLFIELAKTKPNIGFIWIGKQRDHGYNEVLMQMVINHQVKNIRFVDEQGEKYTHYLNCADGFVLTSREDPFPTVMIEAAYLGKPIVSFNSGGSIDFIQDQMGFVVSHLDIGKMIEKMNEIESNESSYNSQILKKEAASFDVTNGVKEWEKIICSVLV